MHVPGKMSNLQLLETSVADAGSEAQAVDTLNVDVLHYWLQVLRDTANVDLPVANVVQQAMCSRRRHELLLMQKLQS